jgi:hypothetical protein
MGHPAVKPFTREKFFATDRFHRCRLRVPQRTSLCSSSGAKLKNFALKFRVNNFQRVSPSKLGANPEHVSSWHVSDVPLLPTKVGYQG